MVRDSFRLLILQSTATLTYLERNEGLDWSTLHSDTSGHNLDDTTVQHFIPKGQTCDGHKLDLEDDVATGVLDDPIVNLEPLVVLVTAEQRAR